MTNQDTLQAARPSFKPVTSENVQNVYANLFAPWVKKMGLVDLQVSTGFASARLPQNPELQWASGAICGQALMAAIDTVVAIAIGTGERQAKGTASQHTQFLRPAAGDDLVIEARVLQFGSTIAYAEAHVTYATSGKLVAHATAEFVY